LVERPELWPEVREQIRRDFTDLAPTWDSHIRPDHLAPLELALERIGRVRVALDLGTGTGVAARLLGRRFPDASVVGLDLSEAMVREAARRPSTGGIRFLVGDAAALPIRGGVVDLVTGVNVLVFGGELTRVLAPGGTFALEYSSAETTPIYVPLDVIERHLLGAGPYEVETGRTGRGIWLLATKRS
jgi:ubiquinone/menaquinone biosynthesis C-methylase UbiE